MTLEQWAYAAEIVGVILVIASLVYVARQLRQNSDLLAAQARYNLVERRNAMTAHASRYSLEAMHKYAAGEVVTPAEKSAIFGLTQTVFEMWEWQYGEYRAGMLQYSQLPLAAWGVWFREEGVWPLPVKELWKRRRTIMGSDFVQFVEDNVSM